MKAVTQLRLIEWLFGRCNRRLSADLFGLFQLQDFFFFSLAKYNLYTVIWISGHKSTSVIAAIGRKIRTIYLNFFFWMRSLLKATLAYAKTQTHKSQFNLFHPECRLLLHVVAIIVFSKHSSLPVPTKTVASCGLGARGGVGGGARLPTVPPKSFVSLCE